MIFLYPGLSPSMILGIALKFESTFMILIVGLLFTCEMNEFFIYEFVIFNLFLAVFNHDIRGVGLKPGFTKIRF